MLNKWHFPSILLITILMINGALYAEDLPPRRYENAKIGQWFLYGWEGTTIRSTILDVGHANKELVYIVFRNEIHDHGKDDKISVINTFEWENEELNYLLSVSAKKKVSKISGHINEKSVTKWIVDYQTEKQDKYYPNKQFQYVVYPEVLGGFVVRSEPRNSGHNHYSEHENIENTGSTKIYDFGDNYDLGEFDISSIGDIEIDDMFLVDPKIGQWVESKTIAFNEFLWVNRNSIIDIENIGKDEMIVVEETKVDRNNKVFESLTKRYSREYIEKRNAGLKAYIRYNNWGTDSYIGDVGGKRVKGYRVFDKTPSDTKMIVSKDIPITGIVYETAPMHEVPTTDFSRSGVEEWKARK